MTHMPPPPNVQYAPNYPQPSQTNAWSIVSLICGILGCFVITPFVAIITGIIGLATSRAPRGGKGMAVAGILLGILWIGGAVAVIGGGAMYGKQFIGMISERIARDAKPQTILFLNQLADGNLVAARPHVDGIDETQLRALSADLISLGHCQEIAITSASADSLNNQITFTFSGQAHFEHGDKPIRVRMRRIGNDVTFEQVELR